MRVQPLVERLSGLGSQPHDLRRRGAVLVAPGSSPELSPQRLPGRTDVRLEGQARGQEGGQGHVGVDEQPRLQHVPALAYATSSSVAPNASYSSTQPEPSSNRDANEAGGARISHRRSDASGVIGPRKGCDRMVRQDRGEGVRHLTRSSAAPAVERHLDHTRRRSQRPGSAEAWG
jgi:hypothetical protein